MENESNERPPDTKGVSSTEVDSLTNMDGSLARVALVGGEITMGASAKSIVVPLMGLLMVTMSVWLPCGSSTPSK